MTTFERGMDRQDPKNETLANAVVGRNPAYSGALRCSSISGGGSELRICS